MLAKDWSQQELIKACIDNDRKAQEQLYRLYFKGMFQMCLYYLKSEEDALDILNSGFLRVFQKIHLFKNEGSLEGWIRKLIYRVILAELKQKNARQVFDPVDDLVLAQHDFTLEKIFEDDILDLIRKLPPATANVFMLFANEGYTHVEIAEKMNISIGTSKWHIANARELLKKQIAKEL